MLDAFANKIKIALRSCQFHIVGIIPYAVLEEISSNIYNLQSKGIFVEFIVIMENGNKSIKTTNTLMRMSAAGGELYCLEDGAEEVANFVHIDKRIALNSNGIDYYIDTDIQTHLRLEEAIYQKFKEKAILIVHQSGRPEIIGMLLKSGLKREKKPIFFGK